MADQSDVENALTAIAANALYPDGTAAPSIVGVTCRVYRGMPSSPALDADLLEGNLNVSIFSCNSEVKNVTRYPRQWRDVAAVDASLLVDVFGDTATFSGTCRIGQLAGLTVNKSLFAYAVQANDSPPTVASNIAAQLRNSGLIAHYAGSSVGVPGAEVFTARVVEGATGLMEIKRQVQDFKISLWCPNPMIRDAAASAIDRAIANVSFIQLADGSSGRIRYAGTTTSDMAADAVLYSRDIIYSAEYPTTIAQITLAMLFGTATFKVT